MVKSRLKGLQVQFESVMDHAKAQYNNLFHPFVLEPRSSISMKSFTISLYSIFRDRDMINNTVSSSFFYHKMTMKANPF